MRTERIVLPVVLLVLALLAVGRLVDPGTSETVGPAAAQGYTTPAAEIAEDIVDGRIEAQMFVAADRSYRLEVQFIPSADSSLPVDTRPSASLAMQDEHMDGMDPPLRSMSSGKWQALGQLPKAGMWVVNVGVGDDFAEAEFKVE